MYVQIQLDNNLQRECKDIDIVYINHTILFIKGNGNYG